MPKTWNAGLALRGCQQEVEACLRISKATAPSSAPCHSGRSRRGRPGPAAGTARRTAPCWRATPTSDRQHLDQPGELVAEPDAGRARCVGEAGTTTP